ncbi:MAG: DMT family transporter [Burkholderiales bacterium]|nr:DMT family transporter [Burkholderiales bacterium]
MRAGTAISAAVLWLLVLLALLWGLAWPVMKLALSGMEPLRFRAFAIGLSTVGLFLIARRTGARLAVPAGAWPRLLAIAFFNMAAWSVLMIYGLHNVEASRAVILAYTFPVWTIPLSAWLMREPVTARRGLGLALGLAGMAMLIGDEFVSLARAPLGALLLVGSAISWAIGTVVVKRWPVDLPAVSLSAWQGAVSWPPIALLALVLEEGPFLPFGLPNGPMLAALYGALVSGIFCQWAWYRLLVITSAAVSSLAILVVPVVGVFASSLLLDETPGWTDFAALALVVASLATVLAPPRGRPERACS